MPKVLILTKESRVRRRFENDKGRFWEISLDASQSSVDAFIVGVGFDIAFIDGEIHDLSLHMRRAVFPALIEADIKENTKWNGETLVI